MKPAPRTTKSMSFLALAGACTLAAGCRDDNGGGDDDDRPDMMVSDDASIYDLQQGVVAEGTIVNVRGVVVTAIDNFGGRKGNLWVQEPDGGAYSGILVFGVDLGQVADLAVGDLVDIEGAELAEFALTADTSGRTTTELVPPQGGAVTAVKVGDGTVPEPAVVDALAIGMMGTQEARDAEWEKWEGVLIRLESVARLTGLRSIDEDDPTFVEFQVTGPMRIDSSLAEIPEASIGEQDNCFASITGIGDYFFNYKLLPRATDDLVSGGTDCPAQEATAETCDDGADNDADGFADCADFSCQTLPECQTDTTVADIQMGTVEDGTVVSLADVYVTAIDDSATNKGFWVADALQGAAHNGVYVYTDDALPAGIAIGSRVDLTGTVAEFDFPFDNPVGDTLTQVEVDPAAGVTDIQAPGTLPSPLTGVDTSVLADITSGEPYEGVLVQIGPAKVEMTESGDRVTVNTASGMIVVDDDAYNYAASTYPADTCFTSITGVMNLNVFDDQRRLAPTRVEDLAVAADAKTCTGL